MEIELKIRTDVYSHKDPKKPKLIKKNCVGKISTYTEDILHIRQIFNRKGNVDKNYCSLIIKELGEVIVNHSYEYVRNLREPKLNLIGFKYKNKDR